MVSDELHRLQKKIETARRNKSRLEGTVDVLMEQLKKDHNCSSIKEAGEKLISTMTDIEKKTTSLNKKVRLLKKAFGDDEDD